MPPLQFRPAPHRRLECLGRELDEAVPHPVPQDIVVDGIPMPQPAQLRRLAGFQDFRNLQLVATIGRDHQYHPLIMQAAHGAAPGLVLCQATG